MVAGHAGRAGLLEREPQDRTESETEERDECERKVREEREREVREVQERKAAKDDRQKQQRREKQARRLKEAEETCNGSGDLPLARTRAELARILGNNHPILYIGQIFDTLEHAKLTEAEYNELCGKRITCSPKDEQGAAGYILRNEKLRRISGCGLVDPEDGESCSYHLNLSYNSTARDGLGGFKVVAFERHDCSKYCSVCPKQPSSAYTSKQLAPLVRAKILTTVQYTPKTVEADLFPAYIKLKPPLSLCKAVLNDAKVMPLDQDTIKMLPAYCAALRTKGHKVKEYYLEFLEMRDVIMQRMKADHDCAQKNKLLQDRNAFDSVAARNIAEETCPEGTHRYLWGVSYAPSTTIAVFDAFEEIDQNDACFMHHETQGIMLSTVTRDAGLQTVRIASSLFLDTEREGPWQLHTKFILETYPGFDSKRRRRIADLNNGLMRSIEDHLNEGSLFLSSDHQKEHVEKRGGKEGVAQYLEAVKCATTDEVAEVKAKMTNVARDCLAGHPDQSLYMASAGNMRGLNTLPNVESLHESSAKARCMHICSAVRQLVKDDQRRFYWRKGMAKQARSSLDEDTGLHASLQSYMAKPIEEARLLSGITYLDKRDKRKAFVPSTRDPTQKYQTDIDAKTCGCGMPEIDIGPCKHLLYHADCIGVPFASLLSTKDSLQGYGAQYPADLEFGRPSESEILSEHGHLINDMIRLPLMVRRPALKRAKSAHELLPQKRARPTCSQCHREGHNKKKCSYMPAPL